MTKNKKIFFIMPEMYPLLDPSIYGHSGGSEAQMFHLANAFYKKGNTVSVVVGNYGQAKSQTISGIQVFLVNNKIAFMPWKIIRVLIDIFIILRENKPDVVLHQNFGYLHGISAILCRLLRVRYVYFTASQGDVDGTRYRTSSLPVAWLWRLGLNLTSTIIVQTNEHRELLLKHFNRDSIVIPNGIDTNLFTRTREHGNIILWVAHWRQVKRPDLVAELARQLPNYNFIMCGGFYDKNLYDRIVPNFPENILIRGYTNSVDLISAYQDALLLINTSDYEGIPITFDEAWACQLPVVSLNVDPDGVITRHNLGFFSGTLEKMVMDIKLLCDDKRKIVEIGSNCRNFVVKNHSIDVMSEKIVSLLHC